jgi:hypothetical protein
MTEKLFMLLVLDPEVGNSAPNSTNLAAKNVVILAAQECFE